MKITPGGRTAARRRSQHSIPASEQAEEQMVIKSEKNCGLRPEYD